MKKRAVLFLATLVLALPVAGAASADTCACGGWMVDRSWNQDHLHYECLWYNGENFWMQHNC